MRRDLILIVLCTLLRHPPSTWGNTEMEDALLEVIARPPVPKLAIEVSCMCGRRMVPFRARELR